MTSGFGDISLRRFSDWRVGVAWMRTRAKEQGNEVASSAEETDWGGGAPH